MVQNTSHAVMSQRTEDRESLDDFPTPPWATRAFIKHILGEERVADDSVWEPACGRGHMAQVLQEKFKSVRSSDIHDYGYGVIHDFVSGIGPVESVDWVITNPPFKLAEEFLSRALPMARKGVALLTRTVFIESVGRFERVFDVRPPAIVAQYVERVPMVRGRVDAKASTATGYAWLVWDKAHEGKFTQLKWIPPSRKQLEVASDYMLEFLQQPAMETTSSDITRQRDFFVLT